METCPTRKKQFLTKAMAEDALIEARVKFNHSNGPTNVYLCDACGYYHLTSKGTVNDRLAALIREGKIDLRKEADQWERKWKKK